MSAKLKKESKNKTKSNAAKKTASKKLSKEKKILFLGASHIRNARETSAIPKYCFNVNNQSRKKNSVNRI